jgi:acetyl-CoA carboxylase biotin carboxylase subunit
MRRALARFRVDGIATTIPLHEAVVGHEAFADGSVTTRWLEEAFMPGWDGAG